MNVLGIDTATRVLNLAIVNNSEIVVDYKLNLSEKTHSATILPALDGMLNLVGIELKDINGIAVSIGPGSFTGLRIGLATAKGLAFALSTPIVGVNSLESYAYRWLSLSGILCPLIEARKGEYYFIVYYSEKNQLNVIKEYQCAGWDRISQELLKHKGNIFVFGEGVSSLLENEKIKQYKKPTRINFIANKQGIANAAQIALLGEKKILNQQVDDLDRLSPFYISKSAAEIVKEKN
ncbi:MAG TPA: tRNA (adenosine(37)-N6)-threonylcarbamoyltransferase complex dimerization subunit type 1 TsaB [Atribacterota bacterium]|nr:tRNA (adenosine(37)-N6)-threonylcarbamoyltransferase complex dimerization subunit type 1 TsaB [Atribacterota bacterium]